ncbi:Holliday junction resolvase, partial [Lentibacillus populi]|uniref:Holliday junction resolvase n=1 Tax=Lentibacillus populi TaxID=1827502 RepID=UPI0016628DFA
MISFTINGELPTLNEIIKASKSHPMAYANMKKDYTALVMMHCKHLPKIDRATIEVQWYCKDKRKDPDNIACGMKFLLDGLVKAGKLKNDGWGEIQSIHHHF